MAMEPQIRTKVEFQNAIEILMSNPDTRLILLDKLNQMSPGNPDVEFAREYFTNEDFRLWVQDRTWELSQAGEEE